MRFSRCSWQKDKKSKKFAKICSKIQQKNIFFELAPKRVLFPKKTLVQRLVAKLKIPVFLLNFATNFLLFLALCHEKRIFRPAFWVHSTQTLVKIIQQARYLRQFYLAVSQSSLPFNLASDSAFMYILIISTVLAFVLILRNLACCFLGEPAFSRLPYNHAIHTQTVS